MSQLPEALATELAETLRQRRSISNFYSDNAHARHGVPQRPPEDPIKVQVESAPRDDRSDEELRKVEGKIDALQKALLERKTEPAVASPPAQPPEASWAKKYLIPALVGAGLATPLLYALSTYPWGDDQKPPVRDPIQDTDEGDGFGSMIQYLEDNGFHIP